MRVRYRFNTVKLLDYQDLEQLDALLLRAVTANSLEEFRRELPRSTE